MVSTDTALAAADGSMPQPNQGNGQPVADSRQVESTAAKSAANEATAVTADGGAAVAAGTRTPGTVAPELQRQDASAASAGNEAAPESSAVHIDANQAAVDAEAATEDQPLSKNQQKKLRKLQRRQEVKAQRKAEEKASRAAVQEARRTEAQARNASMTEEQRAAHHAEKLARLAARRQEAAEKKERQNKALTQGQRLVVDLDFEGLMTAAEVSSICNQLMHSYSANSRAAVPCHLHFTSVEGGIQQQIDRQLSGFDKWKVTRSADSYMDLFAGERQRLVYLTADAETELGGLDPQDIYIIGGLVDRNRHKNICLERAQKQGIRTARLPISGRVQLISSTVLTVNQVVEIMLVYLDTSDWAAALEKVIPARKRGGCEDTSEVGAGGDPKRAKTT